MLNMELILVLHLFFRVLFLIILLSGFYSSTETVLTPVIQLTYCHAKSQALSVLLLCMTVKWNQTLLSWLSLHFPSSPLYLPFLGYNPHFCSLSLFHLVYLHHPLPSLSSLIRSHVTTALNADDDNHLCLPRPSHIIGIHDCSVKNFVHLPKVHDIAPKLKKLSSSQNPKALPETSLDPNFWSYTVKNTSSMS